MCQERETKIIYLPWGPEMLNSSPMLRSAYSHVKELLRKTLSKYKAMTNREKSGIARYRHRGGERET